MAKSTTKNKKRWMLPLAILGVIVVAFLGMNIFLSLGGRPIDPQSGDSIILEIPQGSGTAQIASILKENNLIKSTFVFRLKAKLERTDSKFKAGTYKFSPSMTMKEIMSVIVKGESVGQTFQIIEGLSIKQIAASLDKQGIVKADDFMAEAKNGSFDYPFMYFPEDMVTDHPERFLVGEIIREKLLRYLQDEIPHGIAVEIESYEEKETITNIGAVIYCEKKSHKGIIIGKDGRKLKGVGKSAREEIESLLGTKVFLQLWVKVKENWRDSETALSGFGYKE